MSARSVPGAVSRERLARAFDAAGWHPSYAATDGAGRPRPHPETYTRDTRDGAPCGIVQIYRDRRGRVSGATLFDGDGRAYPFGSRGVVGALRDYLAGVRYDVTTYNGAQVGDRGRSRREPHHRRGPERTAAIAYLRRVNRERSARLDTVDVNG